MVANYVGDASFAFTGSLAAGLAGMDLLGCNWLAIKESSLSYQHNGDTLRSLV